MGPRGTGAFKTALRTRAREARAALDRELRAAYSQRACERATELLGYRRATTVALYSPFDSELDVGPLTDHALRSHKRVALPRLDPDGGMRFVLHSAGEPLVRGRFGIMQPRADLEALSPDELDLVFLPGLAFDPHGARLGYGAGFYDRALSNSEGALRIGIAFEAQMVASVPREPHDLLMHTIVTDQRVIVL